MRRCGVPPPPPPIIFGRLKLPQQIIYRRKENLSESPNHQKYWENILVSRFYEQFSRNRRNLGHFRKFKKFQTLRTQTYYISFWSGLSGDSKYIICFAKNSNFAVLRKHLRISRNTLLLLSSRNLNISRNKLYIWNLQITCFKMIYNMFIFWEFEIFSNFQKWPKFRLFRENCS